MSTITGTDANDNLTGTAGNDTIIGGRGDDILFGGAGADTFVWNPGDGSDVVEGGDGTDTLQFNGANVGENINLFANGSRATLTRDVASIVQDTNSVEKINLATQGGADNVTVNDLTGTAVKTVSVDLSTPAGSGAGDSAVDTVTATGTAGGDHLSFTVSGTTVSSVGTGATVSVVNGAESTDHFVLAGGFGDDTFTASVGVQSPMDVVMSGGAGNDLFQFAGSTGNDTITAVADNGQLAVVGNGGSPIHVTADVETTSISGGAGDDIITAGNGLAPLAHLVLDGGAGSDTITGGDGGDTILAGGGNDLVVGGRGNDFADLGAGNDTFVWNPGDGSDVVEGGDGTDTLQFNGANVGENISVFANGSRTILTRDVANIVQDINGVEKINIVALGGADNITVNDLTGTAVKTVAIDLSSLLGSGSGDSAIDTVTATGTAGNDQLGFTVNGGAISSTGAAATVTVTAGAESTDHFVLAGGAGDDNFAATLGAPLPMDVVLDGGTGVDTAQITATAGADTIGVAFDNGQLAVFNGSGAVIHVANTETTVIHGGDGDDVIVGQNGISTLSHLVLDGGNGDDSITGGDGGDSITGGAGADTVVGGRGDDTVDLGSGNDTFVWGPGDGSDSVAGGTGSDTLQFNGSNANEVINISSDGLGDAIVKRDVASITMTTSGVETLNIHTLGGTDTVTVGDLTGTSVKTVAVDLSALGGAGDQAADTVVAQGSDIGSVLGFSVSGGAISATGTPTSVSVTGGEAGDHFVVAGGAGADTLSATVGVQAPTDVVLSGGAGDDLVQFSGTTANDTISAGADNGQLALLGNGGSVIHVAADVETTLIQGGSGDDQIIAGSGVATITHLILDGGAGNDTITGGDGGDSITSGLGNDLVSGGHGNDIVDLGSGNDTFTWNPGDGSDSVSGGAGTDTVVFNGANISEQISVVDDGQGDAVLTRDVAGITMTMNGVETLDINALGGADTITIGDISETGVKTVAIDLSFPIGSGAGDQATDAVTLNTSTADSHVVVSGGGASMSITGLPTTTTITGLETTDSITINGQDGSDIIDASRLGTGVSGLNINSGGGNDSIIGGAGNDLIKAGDGDDTIAGSGGLDVVSGGAGNDVFLMTPGQGRMLIDGGSGDDALVANGGSGADVFSLVGSKAQGAAAGGDTLSVTENGATATFGLVNVETQVFNLGGGNDSFDASGVTGGFTHLSINAGAGNDTVRGDDGVDTISGGDGADVITVGGGSDSIDGGAGADSVLILGGAGDDTIDLVTGSVTPPLQGAVGASVNVFNVETVTIKADQGFDNITVGDLSGSGVQKLTIGLGAGAFPNAGDNFVDTVVLNTPAEDSHITFSASGQSLAVNGLPEAVSITGLGIGDQVAINATAGNNVLDGSGSTNPDTVLNLNGGAGNDSIVGGAGNDVIKGGAGDDTISGSGGQDVAGGGAGDDVFLWTPGQGRMFIDGGAGNDVLIANTGDAADIVILSGSAAQGPAIGGDTLALLVNGVSSSFNLFSVETQVFNLGAGDDTFDASGIAGTFTHLSINGGDGNDVLIGSQAADTLTGGAGDDRFVFNTNPSGGDVITDFQAHGADGHGDTILLNVADQSFDQAVANHHIFQSGADVIVTDGSSTIVTLQNVSLSTLHANDFAFAHTVAF